MWELVSGKRQNNALYEPNILTGFAGGGKANYKQVNLISNCKVLKGERTMHYCLYLFTRKLPDDEEIRRIMYLFNDENDEKWEQPFHWDWYAIGGRYGGMIHAEVSSIQESDLGIGFSLRGVNKKEVRSWLFDMAPDNEYMMYAYIIDDDHSIRVDGAYIKKIINYNDVRDSGYAFVTEDGRCTARDDVGSRDYDKLLSTVFNDYKEGFLTILDIHD